MGVWMGGYSTTSLSSNSNPNHNLNPDLSPNPRSDYSSSSEVHVSERADQSSIVHNPSCSYPHSSTVKERKTDTSARMEVCTDRAPVDWQQIQSNEWHHSLISRLADICKNAAKSNDVQEKLLQRRYKWVQDNSLFDYQTMKPYSKVVKYDMGSRRHQLMAADSELASQEWSRKCKDYLIRDQLLSWNYDSKLYNMQLVDYPRLDQSKWLEAVVLDYDLGSFISIGLQHKQVFLVQRGEYLNDYMAKVLEAQEYMH